MKNKRDVMVKNNFILNENLVRKFKLSNNENKTGEEITAVRFLLDSKGNVMDLNQLQKAIISGGLK